MAPVIIKLERQESAETVHKNGGTVEFIENTKGGKLVVFNDFMYRCHSRNKSKSYWKCLYSDGSCCPVRGNISDENPNEIILTEGKHSHPPDYQQLAQSRFMSVLRNRIITEYAVPVYAIFREVWTAMATSDEATSYLPEFHSIERGLNRLRRPHYPESRPCKQEKRSRPNQPTRYLSESSTSTQDDKKLLLLNDEMIDEETSDYEMTNKKNPAERTDYDEMFDEGTEDEEAGDDRMIDDGTGDEETAVYKTGRTMEYFESMRGSTWVVSDDFIFRCHTRIRSRSYWICLNTLNCPARGFISLENPNEFIVTEEKHNHPPDYEQLTRVKFMRRLRKRVVEEPTVPVQTIFRAEHAAMATSDEITSYLPRFHSVEKSLYQLRRLGKRQRPNKHTMYHSESTINRQDSE